MAIKIAQLGTSQTVALAAREIRDYLLRMDRCADIVLMRTEAYDPERKDTLWVGMDSAFAPLLPVVEDARLDDAIHIDVQDSAGIITGVNERSVLIAAYRLLRENGVRFLRPGTDGELIPQVDASTLSAHLTEAASYRHRGVCIEGSIACEHATNIVKWLPKLGMNAYFIQFFTPFTFFDRWYDSHNPNRPKQPLDRKEVAALRNALVDEIKLRGLLYHAVGHGWTCEPFGIEGDTWDHREYIVSDATRAMLAEVNGERALWGGVPLNTNLCYGNPEAREAVVNAIADYLDQNPAVDYLHFWLADGTNNHCECPLCRNTMPSDFYVMMLNRLDDILTERGIDTKIVFLIYVDLLWAPQHEKIRNPDRFVLMFAPITRTYTKPFLPDVAFEGRLTPYDRNHNVMPRRVEENIARLREWQRMFGGDGFDFDYHLMWDHLKDAGYYRMADILMQDMKNLNALGLNGMLSCQLQRCYFPTALGMYAMAAALWNKQAAFEDVAKEYFKAAYGEDGEVARAYLEALSEKMDPPYLRNEKPAVDADQVDRYAAVPAFLDAFLPVIKRNLAQASDAAVAHHWMALCRHSDLIRSLAKLLECRAAGDEADTKAALDAAIALGYEVEMQFPDDLDAFEFEMVLHHHVLRTR